MLWKPQEDVFLMPRPHEELYDVRVDSFQFDNLADQPKSREMLTYLRRVMDQWIAETGDSVPEHPTPDRDDIHRERLPGNWEKGERPGASKNAEEIKGVGPIAVGDVHTPNVDAALVPTR